MQEAELREILTKIYKYCAYQDRCTSEVRQKLKELGLPPAELPDWLIHLEEERFLDDERYTRSIVRGKFNHKQWGRKKIRHALKGKQIPASLIDQALREEISPEVYTQTIRRLLDKKAAQLRGLGPHERNNKLIRYLLQKGFEWEEIKEVMNEE